MGDETPSRVDIRILRALRTIMQAVDIHSRKLASEHAITVPQLLCLSAVVEDASLSVASLARTVHLRPSTVVGIIDRLERKGLVRRERDGRDRRVVHMIPTPAGEDLVRTAPSPLQADFAAALAKLPDLEQTAIALSLERVVELMRAGTLDSAPILETGEIAPGGSAPDVEGAPAPEAP